MRLLAPRELWENSLIVLVSINISIIIVVSGNNRFNVIQRKRLETVLVDCISQVVSYAS